ncbi:hypothetical protein AA313_de0205036 [Arthrobotrys entomopaga]|nr:hypothetical protein AA313_de0205036 [Arthrobotrys entomopaga]
MIDVDNHAIPAVDNLAENFYPFLSQITSFGQGHGYDGYGYDSDSDSDDDDDDLGTPTITGPCNATFATIEDLEAAVELGNIPWHCIDQYTLATLKNVYDISIANYNKILADEYDQKFDVYAQSVSDSAGTQVSNFVNGNGNKYFTCVVGEPTYCCSICAQQGPRGCKYCFEETKDKPCYNTCSGPVCRRGTRLSAPESVRPNPQPIPNPVFFKNPEPCPPDYSQRGAAPDNPWTQSIWWTLPQNNTESFFEDLKNSTGIASDKIKFVDHNRGNTCAPSQQGNKDNPCWMSGYDYNFPQPDGYSIYDVLNPKATVEDALSRSSTLGPQLEDVLASVTIWAYPGDVKELIDAISLPILTLAAAVESMQKVEDVAKEIQEEKRKEIIFSFVTSILLIVPLAGEIMGTIATLANIGSVVSLLGFAGAAAFDIYTIINDPQNDPMAILGLMLTPLALTDLAIISKAAGIRRGMKAEEIAQLGGTIATRMNIIQKVVGVCRRDA